jgi:methyl-accepting chemotaxis protein
VKRVTDIVGEMSLAAQEQSTGIEQVSTAMTQMDQVTQANSAHTEELSATAQSLSDQAGDLMALVSTFKLNADNRTGSLRRPSLNAAGPSFVPSAPAQRFTPTAKKPAKVKLSYRAHSVQLAKPNPAHEEFVAATAGGDHSDFEEF